MKDNTIITTRTNDSPKNASFLFNKTTAYYQKQIIFACNSKSADKDLTHLVLKLGRLHKNDLIERSNADTLLRLKIDKYCTLQDIDREIFSFPQDVNVHLLPNEDLKVIYDHRVLRMLKRIEDETLNSEFERHNASLEKD